MADRIPTEGDRLEFVINHQQLTCLVAYDVADPSDFAAFGAEEVDPGEVQEVGEAISPIFKEDAHLGEDDAPPSGSFLKDTFSEAGGFGDLATKHTGETGATWVTSLAMTVEVRSEAEQILRGNSTTYRYAYASGLPASPDYSVEVGLICKSVAAGRQTGPALRISTEADTSYQWVWVTNEGFSLVKRIAGAETVLATYAFVGEEGQKPVATISAVGTAIKAFVNGVERASATDSAITAAGRAGLRQQGIPAQGAVTDYIIATDAKVTVDLAAALSGTGTATGTLTSLTPLSANLSGSGSLGAELRALSSLEAALSGNGALSAELRALSSLEAALSGNGALSAELTALVSLEADLSGTGSLEAQLGAITSFAADLSGQGALAAELSALVSLSAELEGEGQLSAELTPIAVFAATLTATGSLTAAFEAARNVPGFMVLVDEARSRAVGGDVAVGRAAVSDRPVLSEET